MFANAEGLQGAGTSNMSTAPPIRDILSVPFLECERGAPMRIAAQKLLQDLFDKTPQL